MKVHWTNAALDNLIAIHEYIAQSSPVYADKLVSRIIQRSEQFVQFPHSGRIIPEYSRSDVREVIEGSYRVMYVVKSDEIDVLAVIHTAQNIL
jgi:toxin ParE1/3/4